ncbi:MAG: PIN domain-containing protein [Acidobacteria bacterium]|nr:PIN domain-containing protein [Acidobacteriota bacterium]
MTRKGPVVIDACVLANYGLCDTLLRFAELPMLYEPRWSSKIISETVRTLRHKLDWPIDLVEYFESELSTHFPEAWVAGYEPLESLMRNDEKDRHVTAAAVHCGAELIVTFNLRHFRQADLAPWAVRAVHPDEFLVDTLRSSPAIVLSKLVRQARERKRTLRGLLRSLEPAAPMFVEVIRTEAAHLLDE